jgi:hypothetical protein
LKVTFPDHVAAHSKEQTFYFDSDGLLKRHDYTAEVIGAVPAAHYSAEYQECNGIMVPTKRRVLRDRHRRNRESGADAGLDRS